MDEVREIAAEARNSAFERVSFREGARPFGMGFAEIPSSAIVQELTRSNEQRPGGVFRALGSIFSFYALIGIAALIGAAL